MTEGEHIKAEDSTTLGMRVWSAIKRNEGERGESSVVLEIGERAQYAMPTASARHLAAMLLEAADHSERILAQTVTEEDPTKIVRDIFPATTVEHPLDDDEATDG